MCRCCLGCSVDLLPHGTGSHSKISSFDVMGQASLTFGLPLGLDGLYVGLLQSACASEPLNLHCSMNPEH